VPVAPLHGHTSPWRLRMERSQPRRHIAAKGSGQERVYQTPLAGSKTDSSMVVGDQACMVMHNPRMLECAVMPQIAPVLWVFTVRTQGLLRHGDGDWP
jgi:hypothetical protein